jgi:hypothetical protein
MVLSCLIDTGAFDFLFIDYLLFDLCLKVFIGLRIIVVQVRIESPIYRQRHIHNQRWNIEQKHIGSVVIKIMLKNWFSGHYWLETTNTGHPSNPDGSKNVLYSVFSLFNDLRSISHFIINMHVSFKINKINFNFRKRLYISVYFKNVDAENWGIKSAIPDLIYHL